MPIGTGNFSIMQMMQTINDVSRNQLQGALVTPSGVQYQVWAPRVAEVAVEIMQGSRVQRRVPATPTSQGYFVALDAEGQTGDCYRYLLDGERSFPDPASRF